MKTARILWRLLRSARVLAGHDALFFLETLDVFPTAAKLLRWLPGGRAAGTRALRPGQRIAKALHQLGPTAIKLGQALSVRSDLLGEAMAADLSELQDRLPPFSGAEARAIVEAELGGPLENFFRHFDERAVAAASIAQVHFAVNAEGHEVAVKVLRPGIEAAFARDFEMLHWLAATLERARPELERLRLPESVRALEDTVRIEMDLRFEAAAADELADNFADDPDLRIPEVDWHRTARRVLTLERVGGIPIDEKAALIAAGHDPTEVLRKTSTIFFNMVFRDGFFHGDLHPGNLFVEPSGRIAAVDFGIMGRVDRATRRTLAEMLIGFLTRDYRRAAEVHFEAGWVPPHKSVEAFTQACRSIGEPILDRPQHEISMARLLAQLFKITEYFDMRTQPQLLLLQKTMLVAEGTGRLLDDRVNMWMLAQPLIEDWVAANLGPRARLEQWAEDMAGRLRRLPRTLDSLEAALARSAEPSPPPPPSHSHPGPWPWIAVVLGVGWLIYRLT